MSWDESLFGAAWTGATALKARRAAALVAERAVQTADERARLEVLARLLTSAPISVELTDGPGGPCGPTFLFPRTMHLAETPALNREALVVRLAWNAVAYQLGLRPAPGEDGVLAMARHAARVRLRFLADFPVMAPALGRLERAALAQRPPADALDPRAAALEAAVRLALGDTPNPALPAEAWTWAQAVLAGAPPPPLPPTRWWKRSAPVPAVALWGALLAPTTLAPAAVDERLEESGVEAGATERAKPRQAPVQRVESPEQPLQENPLVHSFEKVHTLEAYQGGSKRMDGDDELAAHQKALDELDLRAVVRSKQRARSVYKADLLLEGEVADALDQPPRAGEVLRYDEWDEAKGRWRADWCALSTSLATPVEDAAAALAEVRARQALTTTKLRAVFEQVEAGRAWKLRQRRGSDVDLDAVVARYGALRAGHTAEDRLYAVRRRHTRDTAVLVLLDTSLSTDAWVANRRVLDVEKESVIALGDALDGLFDEVGVAAFCSQSRLDCRFLVAKGFDEGWDVGARRVLGLVPAGFTRIGPALRHATVELGRCGARRKLLLLLTDGKPSDVDRYEGRYGVADVHRAVLDAQASGVTVHALALDPAAKGWLPSMFGHGRATVVNRPDDLVHAMAQVTTGALRA